MIRRFFSYYKPHKKLFAFDIVCSLMIAACNMFYPFVAKNVINTYAPDKMLYTMLMWCGILLVIFCIKAIFNYCVQYYGHVLGVRIQGDMRREFFEHIETLSFSYFDEHKTGAIMSRITNDLFDVSELAHHGFEDTLTATITIIGAVAMLCVSVNVYLALIVLAILPVMIVFAVKTRRNMSKAMRKSREGMAEVNAEVESAVSGIRVAKAYNASETEVKKFNKRNGEFMKARASAYKAMGVFQSGLGFFNDFLYLAAITAGGLFLYKDWIDNGDFVAYVLYTTMIINPIRTLANVFEQIQNGMTGFVRFLEVMDIKGETDCENPIPLKDVKGDVKFENVTFSYKSDNGNNVIENFTLTVPNGKTVALVGPSGGGKTTLCHLLPRFYKAQSGKITIDGVDINDVSAKDLRSLVGIVAQDVFLFCGTIKENIAYGKPNATMDEIVEAAKRADIHEYVCSLADGYDTYVGERGVKLSGGQKQRVSVARAFLKNPPILILDEATSALDNVTEAHLQSALNELSKNRTTIVVAHRLSTVRKADLIVVMDKDGIVEQGTHEELMAKHGEYYRLSEAVSED